MRSVLVGVIFFIAMNANVSSAMASCVSFWGTDNAKTSEECLWLTIESGKSAKYTLTGNLIKGEYVESTAIYPHTILTRIDNSMREYGGWMSRHSGQPSLDVQLTIKTDFVDQFRNSSVGDLMVVTFNGDELARVNWKNMSTGGTLDFATIAYVHPDARQFLATYCEKYPLLAPRFCRRIASGRKYHS